MCWLARYLGRVRGSLRAAFTSDHPPQTVAGSFAFGVFLTALPTLGTAFPVFGWVGYRFERANPLAMLAAVGVMNPVVKSGLYAVSFVLGSALLGPIPDVTHANVGLDAGRDVLVRFLLGNAILSAILAVVGYAVAYRTVCSYRRRKA